MARKPTGKPPGRPRHPDIEDEEAHIVLGLLRQGRGKARGYGIRAATEAVSDRRVAAGGDPVSKSWLERAMVAWLQEKMGR
jgi:hypothetical protein